VRLSLVIAALALGPAPVACSLSAAPGFGMKVHVGTDLHGVVHTVATGPSGCGASPRCVTAGCTRTPCGCSPGLR